MTPKPTSLWNVRTWRSEECITAPRLSTTRSMWLVDVSSTVKMSSRTLTALSVTTQRQIFGPRGGHFPTSCSTTAPYPWFVSQIGQTHPDPYLLLGPLPIYNTTPPTNPSTLTPMPKLLTSPKPGRQTISNWRRSVTVQWCRWWYVRLTVMQS